MSTLDRACLSRNSFYSLPNSTKKQCEEFNSSPRKLHTPLFSTYNAVFLPNKQNNLLSKLPIQRNKYHRKSPLHKAKREEFFGLRSKVRFKSRTAPWGSIPPALQETMRRNSADTFSILKIWHPASLFHLPKNETLRFQSPNFHKLKWNRHKLHQVVHVERFSSSFNECIIWRSAGLRTALIARKAKKHL